MIKTRINNEYKDVVKIFGGGTLQKEIIKVWSREAQEYVYESSVEYTGTLPITINANGDALIDYRICGTDGGVGEPTENLFDIDNALENYVINTKTGIPDYITNYEYVLSDYIPIAVRSTVTISAKVSKTSGSGAHWAIYDENKTFISGGIAFYAGVFAPRIKVVDTSGAAFIRVDYALENLTDCMLNLGSTALPYEPYGYKLPMTVSDGNTVQSAPVYIGENQLGEGEYVSYGEQKIYKRTENLFDGNYVHAYIDLVRYIYSEMNNTRTAVVKVDPSTTYIVKKFDNSNRFIIAEAPEYPQLGKVYNVINSTNTSELTITTGNDTIYILIYVSNESFEPRLTVTNSLVNPDSFIPYIYTQDPPVPFPEIPTIDGKTVIDYDGDPKPSQMYIKYRR